MTEVEQARIELNKALSPDYAPDTQPVAQAIEQLIEAIVTEHLKYYQRAPMRFR